MKKHWTELSREERHVIYRYREAFLREHQKADEIVMSKEGIPLSATYYSREMPGYGRTDTGVPIALPVTKDVK